jgi:hypothetical protein
VDGLKTLPAAIIKPEAVQALSKMVTNIKVEAKEGTVSGGLQLSGDELKTWADILKALMLQAPQIRPAP